MLDLNYIIEKEDLIRKSNLLKNTKLTLESLIFDRSNSNSFNTLWHSFNGNLNRFCRSIIDILSDGFLFESFGFTPSQLNQNEMIGNSSLRLSNSFSISQSSSIINDDLFGQFYQDSVSQTVQNSSGAFWSFLVYLFTEKLLNTSNAADLVESNVALVEFKTILDQIVSNKQFSDSNSENDLILDWISNSLRQRKLLIQLKCLNQNRNCLQRYYKKGAFINDKSYFDDFLIFIRAFEQENYKILNQVKYNKLNAILDQDESMMIIDSSSSSTLDLNEAKNESLGKKLLNSYNNAPNEGGSGKRQQHRRIHSYPRIQINLFKKNSINSPDSRDQQSSTDTSINQNFDSNNNSNEPKIVNNELKIPKLTLNSNEINLDDDKGRFS
jgi:hypothetical protein